MADRAPRLTRLDVAFLEKVANSPCGLSRHPSDWYDRRFQKLHGLGLVAWEKSSRRWRTVRITEAGCEALRRHGQKERANG